MENKMDRSLKWIYALGNNGFFIAMTLYTTYTLSFMTMGLGLSFPVAVKIMSLSKIIDTIASIFFTSFALDNIKFPWGKYRSWLLVGPIVAGLSTVAFFSPLLAEMPESSAVAVGTALVALWNIASNIVLSAFNALNSKITTNSEEMVSLSKLSNQCQGITGFIAGFFIMKIVYAVGGVQSVNLAGMQIIGWIYSVLYFVFCFILFLKLKNMKDDPNDRKSKTSVMDTLRVIFTNRNCGVFTLSLMFGYTAETFFKACVSYWCLYTLFSPGALDFFNYAIIITLFLGATFTPKAIKITGSKKNTVIVGFLGFAACLFATYFAAEAKMAYVAVGLFAVGIFFENFVRALCVPMYTEIADFARYETGKFEIGYMMSAYNLTFKVSGWFAAKASALLALVGYYTGVEITPAISAGINKVAVLGSGVFALIGALIMLLYNLDEKELPRIQSELRNGNQKNQ